MEAQKIWHTLILILCFCSVSGEIIFYVCFLWRLCIESLPTPLQIFRTVSVARSISSDFVTSSLRIWTRLELVFRKSWAPVLFSDKHPANTVNPSWSSLLASSCPNPEITSVSQDIKEQLSQYEFFSLK